MLVVLVAVCAIVGAGCIFMGRTPACFIDEICIDVFTAMNYNYTHRAAAI
jgi:hypothetical protein